MGEAALSIDVAMPYQHEPRVYQRGFWVSYENGIKRFVMVWHRRSGKDISALNFTATQMVRRIGAYYYVFPTYNQGRRILWDGMDRAGVPFLSHFPEDLIQGKPNETEMKLWFKNGSLFQVVGSDNIDSIVGTNPVGVVFSEYSLQDPAAWGLIRPILAENGGWAIFIFTPRGENHAYDIYNLAKKSPQWFCDMQKASQTHVIPAEVLEQERKEIILEYGNDSLWRQEYECDFQVPVVGAYYGEQVSRAYEEGRVGNVPHDSRLQVHTAWDLGVNDRMAIWFIQMVGAEVRLIDYMEGSGYGLDWYIKRLKDKPYIYGRHIAPHDIEVRELTTGVARIDTARKLGIDFEVAPRLSLSDGIDASRALLGRCWFDKEKAKAGLNCLKNYRKKYDEKRKTYMNQPLHDWSSNGSDAFRYLAVSHDYLDDSKSEYEIKAKPDKYERSRQKLLDEAGEDDPMSV